MEEDAESFKNGVIDFIGVNYYSSSVGHHDGEDGEETLFGASRPLSKAEQMGLGH